jgi:hypothetical protein
LTATSADVDYTSWRVAAVVVGFGGGVGEVAEGVAEEVDGLALEAEADVRVDGRGRPDVGVLEQFLDDELDALLQGGGGRSSA